MAKFILFLAVIPLVELYLFFTIGAEIGFLPAVGVTILTAVIGSALARYEAKRVWQDWKTSMDRLEPPTHSVLEGIVILVGGVLLVIPGFLTDAFGFVLLIPWIRRLLLKPFQAAVTRHFTTVRVQRVARNPFSSRPNIVDTTAVDVSTGLDLSTGSNLTGERKSARYLP